MAGGFGLAYAAGGAADALTEIVKQRMLEQQQARLDQEQQFNQWLQRQQNARAEQIASQNATEFSEKQDALKQAAVDAQLKFMATQHAADLPGSDSLTGVQSTLPASLAGGGGPSIATPDQGPGLPTPDPSQMNIGQVAPVTAGLSVTPQPKVSGAARTITPIYRPGVMGQSGMMVTPQSLEDVQAAQKVEAIQKALSTTYNESEGQQAINPLLGQTYPDQFPGGVIAKGQMKDEPITETGQYIDSKGRALYAQGGQFK